MAYYSAFQSNAFQRAGFQIRGRSLPPAGSNVKSICEEQHTQTISEAPNTKEIEN